MGWTVSGNLKGPKGDTGDAGATGAQGIPGEAAAANLNVRGAWVAATAYAADDVVSWGGSTYFATAPTTGTAPTGTSTDPGSDDTAVNSPWNLFVMQGAPGPDGADGAQGDKGDTGDTGDTGPQGVQGATGSTGATGSAGGTGAQGDVGARGTQWFTGHGAPGTIGGSATGDQYLDLDSGDVYTFS